MSRARGLSPDWAWWVRVGERLSLGLGVETVFAAGPGALRDRLREGRGVVEALRLAGARLPSEGWCLLEAGEHTGRLGEAMKAVGEMLRDRERRRREWLGQLWYPALIGVVGLAVMALLLLWVVPQLRQLSTAMGIGRLPWLTAHIGALYGALFGGLGGMVLGSAALAWALRRMGSRSPRWGRLEERAWARIPGIGSLRRCLREARLFRQTGTLLAGGTTLPRALEMAAAGAANAWEREELGTFRRRLLMGAGFPDALGGCALIDPESRALLLAGQECGQLDAYLQRVAREREEQAGWRMAQWTRLLEPLFLLGLSLAVGGLILAYLLPMVRLLENAGGAF